MKLKEILATDLGLLLFGRPSKRTKPFFRLKRAQGLSRRRRPKWRGPWYGGRRWQKRMDRREILGYACTIARCDRSLQQGFLVAEEMGPYPRFRQIAGHMAGSMEAGFPFSESVRRLPRVFPVRYADYIRVGEQTGELVDVLNRLTEQKDGWAQLRKNIRCRMIPMVLTVLVFLFIVLFYSLNIAPLFRELIQEIAAQGGVPAPTLFGASVMVQVADTIQDTSWFVEQDPVLALAWLGVFCAALLLGFLGLKFVLRCFRDPLSLGLQALLVRVPVLGSLIQQSSLIQPSRFLQAYLVAGVPLNSALSNAQGVCRNPATKRLFGRLSGRISTGKTLADAMANESGLPKSFKTFIALGESSGELPEAFGTIAATYEETVPRRLRMVSDVVLAAMLTIPAGLTLFFATSFFCAYTASANVIIISL